MTRRDDITHDIAPDAGGCRPAVGYGNATPPTRFGRLLESHFLRRGYRVNVEVAYLASVDPARWEYALPAGCLAIANTSPGEKYEAPDGTWKTRTSAPPERDPRCP